MIKFAVTDDERERLDIEAAAHGVSRAQLIRDRALNAGIIPRVQMEPEAQQRAVRNLSKHFVGIPEDNLVRLVNAVVKALATEA
tara:strand:- start:3290 stop:3541 length:252 start_codon:yes stop_codon:yes gene_type:complete